MSERLEELRTDPLVRTALAAKATDSRLWAVGGAVRDALMDRPVGEIDLLTDGDPGALAGRLGREMSAAVIELHDDPPTWRVAGGDARAQVDVAGLRGPELASDLLARDFTVNAIALDLASGELIDPAGGSGDIDGRVLRIPAPGAFDDDPLRVLRAARFGAALGFRLDPDCVQAARACAVRADEPTGERKFGELSAMVAGPDLLRALELMDLVAATPQVLPELEDLRGVAQSANHHLDVHAHTIEVLRRWLEIESDLPTYAGEVAEEVSEALTEPLADGLSRRDGIRLAAILHDIAKPATRTEDGDVVRFIGHDRLGARMVRDLLCRRFRTSRRTAEFIAALTDHHLVLGFMVPERPLPRRRVWEYLRRTGREAVDTTLLTCADRLAAQGGRVAPEAISGHLDLAREMLVDAIAWERGGPPRPLLDGNEIADAIGLDPGPALGEAVTELSAAQYAGEVTTRGQAVAHLRAWAAAR